MSTKRKLDKKDNGTVTTKQQKTETKSTRPGTRVSEPTKIVVDFIKPNELNFSEVRRGLAKNIVQEIIDDLSNRRGLREEFERYDLDIKNEIQDAWIRIIMTLLPGSPEEEEEDEESETENV